MYLRSRPRRRCNRSGAVSSHVHFEHKVLVRFVAFMIAPKGHDTPQWANSSRKRSQGFLA